MPRNSAVFGVEWRRDEGARVGVVVALILVLVVLSVAVFAIGSATNPERAQNDCSKPVAFTKAEGTFHVSATVGALTGEITRADVRSQAVSYNSGGFHWPWEGLSLFGKKGSTWVRSYATGPSGEISDLRDSQAVPYDFALFSLQSGSVDGSFRTGEVCVNTHGRVSWHFELIAKDDCGDCKEFRLDLETRTVDV